MPININMSKARVIQMDAIRIARNAELAARDITVLQAVEAGDTVTQTKIAAEKQTLRNIPQTFDLKIARTAQELKGLWPVELPTMSQANK